MNRVSTSARLSRALDWAGLVPSGLLLTAGIGEYQENGSVLWPAGGVLLVLVSVWVVWRGRARGKGGTAGVP
ncbi:hypothetical protein [Streptomyces sp. WMMC940]|uniref:hypothetical protein n=1 Tax=Streptomyces sp. WMMC940 TaxID=3015153 RepID=UPI0022B69B37|nr:hypothetical protein [Streptomyces sp. WMMC940]MCZ7460496.1 hypothetical protein [Streptomyces sp. WMMC940]